MLRVAFYSKSFGTNEREKMMGCPRIGDSVSLFYTPFPHVVDVCWIVGDEEYCGFSKDTTDVVVIVE